MLNDKQERFCREYVIDLNGTQAAIRAGYSEKTANEQAAALLAKLSIKQRVKELQDKIGERLDLTADMVVNELKALGFYSIQDFIADDNSIEAIKQLDREKAKPIVGIKVIERYVGTGENVEKIVTTEIKTADKRAALVDLGKHLGIFEKDNNQKVPPITINFTPVAGRDK